MARLTDKTLKELRDNYNEYMEDKSHRTEENEIYGDLLDTIEAQQQEIEHLKETDNMRLSVLSNVNRENEQLRDMLKRLEWRKRSSDGEYFCPECRNNKKFGHRNCELEKLLKGDGENG